MAWRRGGGTTGLPHSSSSLTASSSPLCDALRYLSYADRMNEIPSPSSSSSRSLGRTVVAVLILAVAAWLLLHVVVGIVTFLAGIIVVVVAVAAVIWAVRVIL
jgi:hypothetical protein